MLDASRKHGTTIINPSQRDPPPLALIIFRAPQSPQRYSTPRKIGIPPAVSPPAVVVATAPGVDIVCEYSFGSRMRWTSTKRVMSYIEIDKRTNFSFLLLVYQDGIIQSSQPCLRFLHLDDNRSHIAVELYQTRLGPRRFLHIPAATKIDLV